MFPKIKIFIFIHLVSTRHLTPATPNMRAHIAQQQHAGDECAHHCADAVILPRRTTRRRARTEYREVYLLGFAQLLLLIVHRIGDGAITHGEVHFECRLGHATGRRNDEVESARHTLVHADVGEARLLAIWCGQVLQFKRKHIFFLVFTGLCGVWVFEIYRNAVS